MFLFTCLNLFSQEDSLVWYFNRSATLSAEKQDVLKKQLVQNDSLTLHRISEKIINKEDKVNFYHQVGRGFYAADSYESARIYYSKALEMAKLTRNKSLLAKQFSALGNIYRLQDKNTIALSLLFQATALYKELDQQKDIAFNLSLIGDINRCIDQPNDALKYLN